MKSGNIIFILCLLYWTSMFEICKNSFSLSSVLNSGKSSEPNQTSICFGVPCCFFDFPKMGNWMIPNLWTLKMCWITFFRKCLFDFKKTTSNCGRWKGIVPLQCSYVQVSSYLSTSTESINLGTNTQPQSANAFLNDLMQRNHGMGVCEKSSESRYHLENQHGLENAPVCRYRGTSSKLSVGTWLFIRFDLLSLPKTSTPKTQKWIIWKMMFPLNQWFSAVPALQPFADFKTRRFKTHHCRPHRFGRACLW